MKVYIAGPYASRDLLRTYADAVRWIGLEVTSTWLNETHEITPGTEGAATELDDEVVLGHALMDLADIRKSDIVLLFTAASVGCEGGGGRHIETGYALARLTPVLVVGQPENVFHRMTDLVLCCPEFVDALEWLRALKELESVQPGAMSEAFARTGEGWL